MQRALVLTLSLLLAWSFAVAQDEDYSKVLMRVTKVALNVYMLEGAGGNIGASVGDEGIVIVDDQYAPLGEKIQAALKGINDRPARFIINPHYHGDHTGGNAYFQKQAPIIAQDADHRTRQCAQAARERQPRRQRQVDSFRPQTPAESGAADYHI